MKFLTNDGNHVASINKSKNYNVFELEVYNGYNEETKLTLHLTTSCLLAMSFVLETLSTLLEEGGESVVPVTFEPQQLTNSSLLFEAIEGAITIRIIAEEFEFLFAPEDNVELQHSPHMTAHATQVLIEYLKQAPMHLKPL